MTAQPATADTFPKLLLEHARVRGDRPAIREKDLGIWQTWTWREVRDEVEWLACGLARAVDEPQWIALDELAPVS